MAVVRGIREKVHLPLYDAKIFKKGDPLSSQIRGNVIKFFVDVQNKTKLETNQQESSVLSHYNTYEARALRVIVEPPVNGANGPDEGFLSRFIYNSITTFVVGEKTMIQAPTWYFPSGAGPSNQDGRTNGWPSPEATFRLAEPVSISHQQAFRVEIEFPQGLNSLLGLDPDKEDEQPLTSESRVWVMLDGFLTRDVQ